MKVLITSVIITSMDLKIESAQKRQIIDITDRLQELITSKKLQNGFTLIVVQHTTTALSTADLDPGGTDLDYLDFLEAITPKLKFRHPHDPAHVPDHILASIIGPSLSLAVTDNKLVLGTWQRVVLVEF